MDQDKIRDGGLQRPYELPDPVPLRILYFDIETGPLLAHIWAARTEYVAHPMLIHDSFLLTWAAKWADQDNVMSGIVTPVEAREQNDERIVKRLANLVREADIVIAHNIDRFDIPMLNNRVLKLDLEPLGPTQSIDTLKLAKRSFRLAYNKLDYLGEYLGCGNKIKTDFDLWKRCYSGDKKALTEMAEYNRQDVILLEKVFNRMLPHVKGLPRLFDAGWDGQLGCPSCGSLKLVRRGYRRTNISTFTQFQCKDCMRYHRTRSSVLHPKFQVTPL